MCDETKRVAGGTMRTCPHSKAIEIVTFSQENGKLQNFRCEFAKECDVSPCPLVEHVKGKL